MSVILKVKDLFKSYQEGKVKTDVLKGVNLEIYSGQLSAIIGQSGSGKSTLLHILGSLDSASSGSIELAGQKLEDLNAVQKAQFRNQKLGFIYQFHHLLGDFNALENVMFPLLINNMSHSTAKQRALEFLCKVGLEQRINFLPSELSGGERQRVAIARALCNQPALVLADEPTGNLDAQNATLVFELFKDLVHEQNTAVVMVTHDRKLAQLCDRVIQIKDGIIDETSTDL